MNSSKVALVLVWLLGPFVIWAAVLAIVKRKLFEPHSILRVVKAGRWFLWLAGIALLCASGFNPHNLIWKYGWSAIVLSLGLSFSESWLKRQSAPDASAMATPSWNPDKWT